MIEKPFIARWKELAPWREFAQVEQDLIISRVLIEIFSDEFLKEHLAFRGGTAIHKLYLNPAPRYSEDIDLVQIKSGPIKPIMERINEVIDFFDDERRTDNRGHGIKALYRYRSEYEEIRIRLKLEINCQEHFNVIGWVNFPFEVRSGWFNGKCEIRTYSINELLGLNFGHCTKEAKVVIYLILIMPEEIWRSILMKLSCVSGSTWNFQLKRNHLEKRYFYKIF